MRIDYTFKFLAKRLTAKYKMATIERHWDKLQMAAANRRARNISL